MSPVKDTQIQFYVFVYSYNFETFNVNLVESKLHFWQVEGVVKKRGGGNSDATFHPSQIGVATLSAHVDLQLHFLRGCVRWASWHKVSC